VGLVGDSRLYQVRNGQLVWRTLDHTRVQELIDQGELGDADARNHPESSMLTRALGHSRMADGRPLVPDVLAEPLVIEPRDTIVMCSDGLHDLLEDWEIGQIVAGREPADAAQQLVELACERGGHDNVTVAVVTAGEVASDYDPNFVPETYADGGEDEPEHHVSGPAAESTLDEFPMVVDGGEVGGRNPMVVAVVVAVVVGLLVVGGSFGVFLMAVSVFALG